MAQPQQPKLADLPTPFLVIRRQTAAANAQRMLDTAARLGVRLRPHIKTHKTVEGAIRTNPVRFAA